MTVTMIANKRMAYGTRMLKAGDQFEAKPGVARIFTKVGRARVAAPADVKPLPKVPPHDEATMLAAEYERVLGRKPHWKMKPETMREQIAEAING